VPLEPGSFIKSGRSSSLLLDFQVQCAHVLRAAVLHRKFHRFLAQSGAAVASSNKQFVDECIATAVFQAVAQCDREVPDDSRADSGYPQRAQSRVPGQLL